MCALAFGNIYIYFIYMIFNRDYISLKKGD